MKVLLLVGVTALGLAVVLPTFSISAPAAQIGGECVRDSTRAGRHLLRHSNLARHAFSS